MTLSAGARGTSLGYQWMRNGTLAAGGSGSVLSFVLNAATQGEYRLRVSNTLGRVESGVAEVRVGSAAQIVRQPESRRVNPGVPVELSVLAEGSELSYQWRKNGVALAGANTERVVLGAANGSVVGVYDVQLVSGEAGGWRSGRRNVAV